MRKLVFFCLIPLLLACTNKHDICIQGQLDHGNGRVMYLSLLTADGLQKLDSSVIRHDSFKFKIKKSQLTDFQTADEPAFFQLSFSPDNGMTTLLKQGQMVHISADANNLIRTYRVQGPEDAVLMWQLDSALAAFAQYTDTLLQIYQYYMEYDSVRSGVERHYNQAVKQHTQYLRNFIQSHPHSFSSMIAFYQVYNQHHFFNEKDDAELLRMLTDSLSERYPDSQNVRYLQSRIR